jgi:thiosulfate dehydrogenase [quinone] large subunit
VPVGGAASFTDPGSGDPALVIQPNSGRFLAFNAVCPHAGCTVSYQPAAGMFVCPCHGSEFNGRTGDVIAGPAPRGLTPIRVTKGPGGQLYAE